MSIVSKRKVGEVPDAWKKIKKIVSRPRVPPYDRYSQKGIRQELEELKEAMRMFWEYHLTSHHLFTPTRHLFVEGIAWSERLYYAGLELTEPNSGRKMDDYYPSQDAMRMFVFLSEQIFYPQLNFHIRDAFRSFRLFRTAQDPLISLDLLVDVLHQEALFRLIHAIDGECIANLLLESHKKDLVEKSRLTDKVAECFNEVGSLSHDGPLLRLARSCLFESSAGIVAILKSTSSDRAHHTAELLVSYLQCIAKGITDAFGAKKDEPFIKMP